MQDAAKEAWDQRVPLRELLAARPDLDLDLDAIFNVADATRYASEIVGRLDALPAAVKPR